MLELKKTLVTTIRQQDLPSNLEPGVDYASSPEVELSMQAMSLEDARCLTFPHFSELPYELRRAIWLYAHPAPRKVVLDNQLSSGCRKHPRPSIRSPFAQLLTNHEARALLMENYPRMFRRHPDASPQKGWYFNPRKDTLCLVSGLWEIKRLLQTCPEDFKMVRYLDVNPSTGVALYESMDDHSQWPRDQTCAISLRDISLKLITIRHFPNHHKNWSQFKETVLVLRMVLQHEQTSICDEKKCTRLAIRIDHDNKEYDNQEGWGRHTFCKIHDEGKFDSHTCIDFELLAFDHDPFGGPWNKWNAKGSDVHLPERFGDDTLPAGTREIDLHKYTASDWSVLPIRGDWTPESSPS